MQINLNPSMDKQSYVQLCVYQITYPLPDFNICIEVWELISKFVPYFILYVNTCPCWDQS